MPLTDLNIVRLLIFSFVLGPNLIPMLSTALRQQQPTMTDPGLKVEVVAEGLDFPTSMSFLESDDILVLEKDDGKVERIIDGTRSLANFTCTSSIKWRERSVGICGNIWRK